FPWREGHGVADVQRLLDQEDERQQDEEGDHDNDGRRYDRLPVEAWRPVVPTGAKRSGGTCFQRSASKSQKRGPSTPRFALRSGRRKHQRRRAPTMRSHSLAKLGRSFSKAS